MTRNPGIQAIGATAPDLRPVPGTHPTISRDHEYKRHGTVTLMAGIDLLTGQVHAFVRVFLTTSHPKMPNLILTPEKIANVSAYILSLRQHQ